ncbi:MAG: HAD family hydrolase [Staphylococcus warneri]|uniref:HAD family hydrolase n=1 Tax=Staphylococcus warneri TaxID=1292 RepID=UPI0009A4B57F|nr:HAD family hydrolase [Staphylococcus warneri]MCM3482776.1 HAD family hydrolase [Staphylococcus warneri]MCR4501337.1 HAD family hydrolase [Staphylococcus warneri]MCT1632788.1 HAD family hydrolase [Staphylococcus warneri]MCT2347735.1 HAD family hydrolase [Staphylococcus warneri]MCV7477194.1 HAD family hydrolase [Staphylococcus warneri]
MEWILFDKDGTLIEFDKSWEKIGIRLVDKLLDTFPVHDKEVAHRQLGILDDKIVPDSVMGSGSQGEMIKSFDDVTGQDTSEWTRNTSQELVDSREPENHWIDGVYDTIVALRQDGYKIGIVTSDTNKGVTQFLEATQSKDLFDLVISTETHAEEKPSPKVLDPLFEAYDVKPEQVVIVGDTANDMKTAINAHLGLSIGVLTGIAKREELHEADVIIESAKEVKQVLDKQ